MAQFKAINPQAEVNGQTVLSVVNVLKTMRALGLKILEDRGLVDIKPDAWYSQQLWLNAFKQISDYVGSVTLYEMGASLSGNASFPHEINDIYNALASIDVAYHMNHRLNNKVLFDPSTGKMSEGIGNYLCEMIDDNKIKIICNNPYPCDFDKGIIEHMAKKFKPSDTILRIGHDESKGCRKRGKNFCEYNISLLRPHGPPENAKWLTLFPAFLTGCI